MVATLTFTKGTLDTNSKAVSISGFSSNNSNARTLTLGASAITCNGTWNAGSGGTTLSVTVNTAVVTITASYLQLPASNWNGTSFVVRNPANAIGIYSGTIANLTLAGGANKTSMITAAATGSFTVTGTLTIGGNTTQGVNRLLFSSNTVGSQSTITTAAVVITGDVNFMDINIAYSGAPSWINSGNAYIGDALGNGGAVAANVNASATQTATGTTSFTWSTHSWSGAGGVNRVPLPQDDVIINNAFSPVGRTVTMDMPRASARSIDFTGATGSPAFSLNVGLALFGSLTLIPAMTFTGGQIVTFYSRTTATITNAPTTSSLYVFNGPGAVFTLANNTTLSGSGAVWTWTAGTLSAGSTVINLTDTGASLKTFAGGGQTYGTLKHIATGAGALTITGNNTFGSLDLECTTVRTVTLPASGTQTVTGTLTLTGAVGQLLSLVSSTPTTAYLFTITGKALADYTSITDCNANSGASVWATHSTNGGNNHNVIFAGPTRLSLGGVG